MHIEDKKLSTEERLGKIAKDIQLSLLAEGKYIWVNVSGLSMYPFIKSGDRIKVVPVNEEDARIGDAFVVDTMKKNETWFYVHRLVRIITANHKKMYVTKGDAHKRGCDIPVDFKRIAGKVVEIQRGTLLINVEQPPWRYSNKVVGYISFKYPKIIPFVARYIDLIIEWRLFPFRVKRRLNPSNFLKKRGYAKL